MSDWAAQAESMTFTRAADCPRPNIQCHPCHGITNIDERPPTRGGTVYDQYHKVQKTIHDDDPANNIYKKTPEQMFEMKMQLKYGSPLVGGCMDWGNETEWVTTMRPGGVERGSAAMIKR